MNNLDNRVEVSGKIMEEYSFSHEFYGEKFYKTKIAIKRYSLVEDIIPIIVPEKFYKTGIKDTYIEVSGTYRSFREDKHLMLYVLAKNVNYYLMELNKNEIYLKGIIANPVFVRATLKKSIIADMFLLVTTNSQKKAYIPCVVWNDNAFWAENMAVGTKIEAYGRIQSREYLKNGEIKVAYEVSLKTVNEI